MVSGGKDSCLAAWIAEQHGWDVSHLVTVRPRAHDSWMFHVPNLDLVPLLAEAWEKPLAVVDTCGEEGRELSELTEALRDLRATRDLDGLVSGAVASEYQRTRLEGVAHAVGLKSFTPLWHKPPPAILAHVAAAGWDVRIAAVAAEGLDARWLGRRLDPAAVEDLARLERRFGVHPGGEGGEYESLVLDAPFLHRRIEVEEADSRWERDRGTWTVRRSRLAAK